MISGLWLIFLFFLLYLAPGLALSRFFNGSLRKSVFFYILGSFLIVPVFYTFLISLNILSPLALVVLSAVFVAACLSLDKVTKGFARVNSDSLFPPFSPSPLVVGAAVIFFLVVMSPRLGLWQGWFPVGDDQHQLRKITSVAESPADPLFYHFPTTRLTIYYFNNVQPGLWVKLSNNLIKVNQAWFIHVAVQTLLLLWIIIRLGGSFFKEASQRFLLFFGLTFFSGLEFYVYKLKGPSYVDQLEWWSDWFLPQSHLHMQISNPTTLFFWVPQHLMAALFVLIIYIFLRSGEKNRPVSLVFLALLWAGILGNSAFIFLSTVVVYALYWLVEIWQKRNFFEAFKFNLPIVVLALILSAKNIELFLTAEKGGYFVYMANVFWFLPNVSLFNKAVNLVLTVPLYLFVELGVLFFVLILSLAKFVRDTKIRERYLFFYLFIFLLPIIFFVKSLDDDNISMRSFIPAQIGLALMAAELWPEIRQRLKRLSGPVLLFLIVVSLPSGLFDLGLRFKEQFSPANKVNVNLFEAIDSRLPLNSIVFANYNLADRLSALGHRFTFKDPNLFSATDREHTARSQVEKYAGLNFGEGFGVYKVLEENSFLTKGYQLYSAGNISYRGIVSGPPVLSSGGITVYPLKIEP
ncbi:MAG: hypothetical protein M1352_02910 [Patescibacteria group bacterium]|nr:hypothetical protein [Patescibacteria group bacterium]